MDDFLQKLKRWSVSCKTDRLLANEIYEDAGGGGGGGGQEEIDTCLAKALFIFTLIVFLTLFNLLHIENTK